MMIWQKLKILRYVIIGFGHFETNGIELVGSISTGSKYNFQDLFKLGDYIFSGHYHINQLYSGGKKHNRLLMVGSSLQLDWRRL